MTTSHKDEIGVCLPGSRPISMRYDIPLTVSLKLIVTCTFCEIKVILNIEHFRYFKNSLEMGFQKIDHNFHVLSFFLSVQSSGSYLNCARVNFHNKLLSPLGYKQLIFVLTIICCKYHYF